MDNNGTDNGWHGGESRVSPILSIFRPTINSHIGQVSMKSACPGAVATLEIGEVIDCIWFWPSIFWEAQWCQASRCEVFHTKIDQKIRKKSSGLDFSLKYTGGSFVYAVSQLHQKLNVTRYSYNILLCFSEAWTLRIKLPVSFDKRRVILGTNYAPYDEGMPVKKGGQYSFSSC